ncbi:MAG: polyprenyl synthetase family protein [Candidatus Hydrogenedentes bacterium]|nr:polyprenyl synthetase family protein [Candidatus Hydrogenedentota bacterium]
MESAIVTPVVEFLNAKAIKTEAALERCFHTWSEAPETLREAMRYSLFAGGKRLRPALALGACEIVSGADTPALPAACALEMIHTYSLIHDDLPAMDNDDLRRGKPTSHRVFGEAMAILAGDGLLTMAFDVAAQSGNAAVVAEIARAAGVEGMVGGQVIDMESEGKRLSVDELKHLHRKKTGALIRVAVRSGAMLGGAGEDALRALTGYGEHIGLAFQIADDVLDVTGTEEALGKPIGSDEAREKSTYPAAVGLERARALARESVDAAVAALVPFGREADSFRGLARYIVDRDR